MTILNCFESLPAEFVALTVKFDVLAVVGVPEISPPSLKLKPLGRLPLSIDQIIGAVPLALSVCM